MCVFFEALVALAKWLWPWHTSEVVMSSTPCIGKMHTTIVYVIVVGSNDLVVILGLENFLKEGTHLGFLLGLLPNGSI